MVMLVGQLQAPRWGSEAAGHNSALKGLKLLARGDGLPLALRSPWELEERTLIFTTHVPGTSQALLQMSSHLTLTISL